MNTAKRILVLAGLVTAGFSAVFLLPETPPMHDTRLARHLPEAFGEWRGTPVEVSQQELKVLAKDTTFERYSFEQRYDSTALPVEVSIVFSGKDLNNSIHRPETCLKTQGWDFARMRFLTLPQAAAGGPLPVKEILYKRTRLDANGKPAIAPNGSQLEDWQLIYYTFIGHTTITPGHYGRTFADIRDRVVGGFDQTWAYVTFSARVIGKYEDQGFDLKGANAMNVEETGRYLEDFIGKLTPLILAPPPEETSSVATTR
ncbi:exosortase-associated EpsI family protein [Luteolibacter marinus]|uniref:exosortase-associated EpsI family protein n=1 Tax=Luteolibacter marinus TaxID=2776705 RepID=UPI001866A455|nr:exosortase-associated EpsI family protein [Luteolibacter marinus]